MSFPVQAKEVLASAETALRDLGPLVAVWGAAHNADPADLRSARDLGYQLGRRGFGLVTGTVGGVSTAANQGAAQAGVARVQLRLAGHPPNPHATTILDVGHPGLGKLIFGQAYATVAYAGGLGTLTDIIDSWYALRQDAVTAPLILAPGKLRDALLGMLDGPLRQAGLFSQAERDLVHTPDTIDEIVAVITRQAPVVIRGA